MTRKFNFRGLFTIVTVISFLLFNFAGFALAAEAGALDNARAQIEVAGDEALVTIIYSVLPPDGSREMPIGLLQMEDAVIEDVRAYDAAGQDLPVTLEDTGLGKLAGTVELAALQGQGEAVEVSVSYRVSPALKADRTGAVVNIPIIATSWPPSNAVPGVFISEVRLPDGYSYVDGFPSGAKVVEDQSVTIVRHDLQVVPAFVRLQLTSGKKPFLTFPRKMVLGTAVIIAAAVMIGFSRQKREDQ